MRQNTHPHASPAIAAAVTAMAVAPVLAMVLSTVLAALLVSASPAAAGMSNAEEINHGLCVGVAARILCKHPDEFTYITTKNDGTLVFTVFYANKDSRISCFVSESFVHIKAELKFTEYHSVPYTLDPATMCATADLEVPQCPAKWPIKVCAQKSAEDIQEEKSLEFWSRPIPELLREELESGIAREQNATEPGADTGNQTGAQPGQ